MFKLSLNQPKLCSIASWESEETILNDTAKNMASGDMFITNNDTIYICDQQQHESEMPNVSSSIRLITITCASIFVAKNGDIYISGRQNNTGIYKWIQHLGPSKPLIESKETCDSLFIDIHHTLYCSLSNSHKIVQYSLYDITNSPEFTVGSGCCNCTSYDLCRPKGIFVDIDLNLYVADYQNNRVQLFEYGQQDGRTVVKDIIGKSSLNGPTDVMVDTDRNLFILDQGKQRVLRFGVTGLHCIIGCPGTEHVVNLQLNSPLAMGFDTHGNIFVLNGVSPRLQRFNLTRNICGEFY